MSLGYPRGRGGSIPWEDDASAVRLDHIQDKNGGLGRSLSSLAIDGKAVVRAVALLVMKWLKKRKSGLRRLHLNACMRNETRPVDIQVGRKREGGMFVV
jgi:hypothetical protein